MADNTLCPHQCTQQRVNGVLTVDFDHLFHLGPIIDDYGTELFLPVTDERAAYLSTLGQ